MQRTLNLVLLAVVLSSLSVSAQITYLDATAGGNTTLSNGTPFTPNLAISGSDDNWTQRAFANGGTAFESNAPTVLNKENAPMLRTTITGLIPLRHYYIYAYFWGAALPATWRGRAAVATSEPQPEIKGWDTIALSNSTFSPMTPLADDSPLGTGQTSLKLARDASGFESSGHFQGKVLIQEGNRWLFEVPLGVFQASVQRTIDVYLDDLANGGGDNRTWYDGVGYEIAPLMFGQGCGTPVPPGIGFAGAPIVSKPLTISLSKAKPSAIGILAIGASSTQWGAIPLPFDLAPIGFPGCPLNVSFDLSVATATDANGEASMTFPVPFSATLYWQWIVMMSPGLQVTAGLATTLHR